MAKDAWGLLSSAYVGQPQTLLLYRQLMLLQVSEYRL